MGVTVMRHSKAEHGFTLIKVMIAAVILVIGLVSLLAVFTQAIGTMAMVQEDLIVKQKAREALESVYTARNTQQLTFDMIQNVADGGIILDGFQDIRLPGADGLVNTADDGALEQLVLPGPDGLLGTLDDVQQPLNMQRQILIESLPLPDTTPNPDLRQLTVSVQYVSALGLQRTYAVGAYVSRFR